MSRAPHPGLRTRLLALAAVVAVCLAGGAWYVVHQAARRATALSQAPTVPTASVDSVRAGPHIVFRSTALGTTYGKVAMVPLSAPSGPRAVSGTDCERVFAAAGRILCLAADRGIVTTYSATVLDDHFRRVTALDLSGVASRARLSRDGTLAATTTFVSGHSYASASFSTQTLVSPTAGGVAVNLEDFTLVHHGTVVRPADRNIWGVTFADDDTFYATVSWGGSTWLSKGSLSRRTLTTVRADAECPSLSPDRTHVVYKKRLDLPPGRWRLASYDLRTGAEQVLAEQRSVDDQVEWLDDHTVVYGLPRSGAQAAVSDVWAVATDGTGAPRLLIEGAWSPAVVR